METDFLAILFLYLRIISKLEQITSISSSTNNINDFFIRVIALLGYLDRFMLLRRKTSN